MEAQIPQLISGLLHDAGYKLGKGQLAAVYQILRRALVPDWNHWRFRAAIRLKTAEPRLRDDTNNGAAIKAMAKASTEVLRGDLQCAADQVRYAIAVIQHIANRSEIELREPERMSLTFEDKATTL